MGGMRAVLIGCMLLGSLVGEAFAGDMVIQGSTTVLPIIQAAAEVFMASDADISISVSGGGSGNGIKALIDGTCQIAMSSRTMKEQEIESAKAKGVNPNAIVIAVDALVPVVHPENPITNLSSQQLLDIYKGLIKSWQDVGGLDKPIAVFSRDTSSGTYEIWEERIMKKEPVTPRALITASSGAIVQGVAQNPLAIGYVGIGYVDKSVKGVSIDGVMGTAETAKDKIYSVARDLYLYTNGAPAGDVEKFVNFMLSADGQKIVIDKGFVPLTK